MENSTAVQCSRVNFSFPDLRNQLEFTANKITQYQKLSEISRKQLIQHSRLFKLDTPEYIRSKSTPLLKLFQLEVDALSRRCRFAEAAFLKIYTQLLELPDHAASLKPSQTQVVSDDKELLLAREKIHYLQSTQRILEKRLKMANEDLEESRQFGLSLQEELTQRHQEVSNLEAQLAVQSDYNEIKEQLGILKRIYDNYQLNSSSSSSNSPVGKATTSQVFCSKKDFNSCLPKDGISNQAENLDKDNTHSYLSNTINSVRTPIISNNNKNRRIHQSLHHHAKVNDDGDDNDSSFINFDEEFLKWFVPVHNDLSLFDISGNNRLSMKDKLSSSGYSYQSHYRTQINYNDEDVFLDTEEVANTVKTILQKHSIGQRAISKYVVNICQPMICGLLRHTRPWNGLTSVAKDACGRMWEWANNPSAIRLIEILHGGGFSRRSLQPSSDFKDISSIAAGLNTNTSESKLLGRNNISNANGLSSKESIVTSLSKNSKELPVISTGGSANVSLRKSTTALDEEIKQPNIAASAISSLNSETDSADDLRSRQSISPFSSVGGLTTAGISNNDAALDNNNLVPLPVLIANNSCLRRPLIFLDTNLINSLIPLVTLNLFDLAAAVRLTISSQNISQEALGKHLLGFAQSTVSELLARRTSRVWSQVTTKTKETFVKLCLWHCNPLGIKWLLQCIEKDKTIESCDEFVSSLPSADRSSVVNSPPSSSFDSGVFTRSNNCAATLMDQPTTSFSFGNSSKVDVSTSNNFLSKIMNEKNVDIFSEVPGKKDLFQHSFSHSQDHGNSSHVNEPFSKRQRYFGEFEKQLLEAFYQQNKYPTRIHLTRLSKYLSSCSDTINMWFRNRRSLNDSSAQNNDLSETINENVINTVSNDHDDDDNVNLNNADDDNNQVSSIISAILHYNDDGNHVDEHDMMSLIDDNTSSGKKFSDVVGDTDASYIMSIDSSDDGENSGSNTVKKISKSSEKEIEGNRTISSKEDGEKNLLSSSRKRKSSHTAVVSDSMNLTIKVSSPHNFQRNAKNDYDIYSNRSTSSSVLSNPHDNTGFLTMKNELISPTLSSSSSSTNKVLPSVVDTIDNAVSKSESKKLQNNYGFSQTLCIDNANDDNESTPDVDDNDKLMEATIKNKESSPKSKRDILSVLTKNLNESEESWEAESLEETEYRENKNDHATEDNDEWEF